jgi:hypothetical protein
LLWAVPVAAQWEGWDYDFDQEKRSWNEIQTQIPAYPKQSSLVEFEAGAASPHHFFIDADSISVGNDGVVRYTLLIRTSGGATNVTFEGIRCASREHKYYAIGRSDGSWSRARDPQWRRIEYKEINRQHGVLASDFFCHGKFTVKNAKEALDLLKQGRRS